MSTSENESAWSTTAATNSTADAGVNWAEGQDPASVNNSARGMMAARAKARLDQGGSLAAGGTANALTVTTNQVLISGHITAGLRLAIRATAANTSATVTFAPDGLTAANIKRADGSALAIGSITSGMMLDLVYNAGSSEWRCVNIAPLQTAASVLSAASFSAHKNGVDQSISTTSATKVTFGTEIFDSGSYFASSTWTPPAGTVSLAASLSLATYDSGGAILHIYKNGSAFKSATALGSVVLTQISIIDQANGTDTYEVYSVTITDAAYTVNGVATLTWFMGAVL